MVRENGRPIASVARDLGLAEQTLRNWLGNDQKSQSSDKAKIMELEATLRAEKRRTADLEEVCHNIKKSNGLLRDKQPEVNYRFIKEHSSVFPVEKMCQVLEISRSGYYD